MRAGQPGVLLLGVEESPALPVIWSLARHHVPLTVGSCRRLCGGTFSKFPNRKCLYPDPAISGDAFVTWLLDMVKTGAYPVTLGCGEEITYLLSKHKQDLMSHTSVPVVELDTFMKCRDKSRTMKAAAECGVPIPATWFPEETGIDAVLARATYPAVIKPCIGDGARGISFVDSPEKLEVTYVRTRRDYGPCIVQEFIPHDGMQYKAELLLDRDSRVRMSGAYAKLRYYPPSGGSSTLNQTVHRPELIEQATRILTHIRWSGMGDCDFIVDPRDGRARLMEINPRFTRSIRVLTESGLDYPYQLYRLALGLEPEEAHEYSRDVYLRYLPADIAWFLRSADRFRAQPSFFRLFSRNLHYEEWSLHDPLTGVGFWLSLLADLIDPVARRKRLR